MRTCKFCWIILILFSAMGVTAGCSSSGGENTSSSESGYSTYTTNGSDLVLQIPDTLQVSQDDIEQIHFYADQVPHCHVTNRSTVDIVLAQACIYYDQYYLYPQYFPQNLNSTYNVGTYVGNFEIYDRFTYYYSPEEFTTFVSMISGNRASIGFTAQCTGQTISNQHPLLITNIEPFTRAWTDGFQVGDKIVEIDGTSVLGITFDAARDLIPDVEGETVDITVNRNGTDIPISTAVEENMGMLLAPDLAYLNVRVFSVITGEEIIADFEKLQTAAGGSVDKLILDLRNNGGGAVTGALVLTDYLIDSDTGSDPILTTWGPGVDTETDYLGDQTGYSIGNFDKTNFVLLVNEHSASASELVASALKYYGTATLVGETTFGKGIGQFPVELVDGSGVVIPAFNSLPPSGVSYHGIGIAPDYEISTLATAFDDDPARHAAVEFLTSGSFPVSVSSHIVRETRRDDSGKQVDPFRQEVMKRQKGSHCF